MTRALLALLPLLAGCDRVWQLDFIVDAKPGVVGDGGPDGGLALDAPTCVGSNAGLFRTCISTPLEPTLDLRGMLDTTSDTRCITQAQPSGAVVCVIAATSLTVSAPLTVQGALPLVLVAADSITITDVINASSSGSAKGPGAQDSCGTAGIGTGSGTGGGGGAGGPFAFAGGNASIGGGSLTSVHPADAPPLLADVRGGCPGYAGGVATSSGSTPAPGGAGGGAIYFIAGSTILAQSGTINASGAAGAGGAIRAGGGGGGAGGLIGFDAPTVTIDAQLIARGAGGGGGGTDTTPGKPGSNPTAALGGVPGGAATEGSGASQGWPGCGAPTGEGGGNGDATLYQFGGGGGGGACGYIRVYAATYTLGGIANPAVVLKPR